MKSRFFLRIVALGFIAVAIRATSSGAQSKPETKAAPGDTLQLVGRIVDKATGLGIHGAAIYLTPGARMITASDSSGQFAARNLPPGTVNLIVRAMRYSTLRTTIEVKPGVVDTAKFELVVPP